MSIIKKIQPENAKYYGIVLWTKHKDYFEEFLKRIGKIATENLGARQETIDDEEEIDFNELENDNNKKEKAPKEIKNELMLGNLFKK